MKRIKLTQGHYALVDDEDYEWINSFKWYYNKVNNGGGYAKRRVGVRPNIKTIMMHRVINSTSEGFYTDHKDRNTLNNQRCNLRSCTKSENQYNRTSQKGSLSRYKGVSWLKKISKWQVSIQKDKKRYSLGIYKSEKEAAIAYNKKALELHGEYAYINEIDI